MLNDKKRHFYVLLLREYGSKQIIFQNKMKKKSSLEMKMIYNYLIEKLKREKGKGHVMS